MESGRSAEIRSLDLDRSDNLSEAVIRKFIDMHHLKLEGLVLTGMGQISDMLFITELNKTKVLFYIHRYVFFFLIVRNASVQELLFCNCQLAI